MYTTTNFKTKKALREAIARGERVTCYQPNAMSGDSYAAGDRTVYLEGPHYPKPHTWYAEAILCDGVVIKVK